MRRALSLCSRNFHLSQYLKSNPNFENSSSTKIIDYPVVSYFPSKLRFFSSLENDSSSNQNTPESIPQPESILSEKQVSLDVEDVNNKELKLRIEEYFNKGNEEALPSIFEAILKRKLTRKHELTDDELLDELQMKPLDNVNDEEVESDFEEAHNTDEEIEDLYDAPDIVKKRMASDKFFNMDDGKWDDMIKEATEHGHLRDTRECEEILQEMLSWDKILPDEIKEKVEVKFNEIGERVEKGEITPEEGYAFFKEFEDGVVVECSKLMEEDAPQFDGTTLPDNKKDLDDPPGEGPVLRWLTRVVFAPGGDAWHPKNRKVKLAVTVKELGLSKHQFRRLRELVGTRYHPGRDELTITSERFEHREENRKDCLRTLFALIEEAGKANKMVEDVRTSYVKLRLKANPAFMERLHAKTMKLKESSLLHA
ncbi:unnamed protein product [Withania somnifera]